MGYNEGVKQLTLLTKPIPLNALYRSINGRSIISKRGRETKEALAWEIASQWKNAPIEGPVTLAITLYFGDKRKRDIDSYLKVLLDCMNERVYVDDSQVIELHVYKCIDTKEPRTLIEVS